jgi:hypothetical protein
VLEASRRAAWPVDATADADADADANADLDWGCDWEWEWAGAGEASNRRCRRCLQSLLLQSPTTKLPKPPGIRMLASTTEVAATPASTAMSLAADS